MLLVVGSALVLLSFFHLSVYATRWYLKLALSNMLPFSLDYPEISLLSLETAFCYFAEKLCYFASILVLLKSYHK